MDGETIGIKSHKTLLEELGYEEKISEKWHNFYLSNNKSWKLLENGWKFVKMVQGCEGWFPDFHGFYFFL